MKVKELLLDSKLDFTRIQSICINVDGVDHVFYSKAHETYSSIKECKAFTVNELSHDIHGTFAMCCWYVGTGYRYATNINTPVCNLDYSAVCHIIKEWCDMVSIDLIEREISGWSAQSYTPNPNKACLLLFV